ncbi:MAG: NADH-quinone oxidoreductase subunit L [Chloroflexi bacterium]|nr:MAG: NADH-quinone oxidoreductase subunit L [Chloroflexota bacterium]
MGAQEAYLIPALPAAAFVVLLLFGKYLPRGGDFIAIAAIAGAFVLFFPVLADFLDKANGTDFVSAEKSWKWVQFDNFEIRLGFFVDQITIVMLAVVSFVALLVQVYSVAYMRGDPKYGWYFTCMSLFAASMLTLVLADNLLLLYAAWEGVGFCSFLLIGFWWERRSAAEAAKKAFITTRIGDVGFLIGILLLWREAGTFDITEIFDFAERGGFRDADIGGLGLSGNAYLTIAVLFLFAGAVGKSGQFPLHVWLPDAMEGPTPVSALIHAATMVVAGVYMVARMFPLFVLADDIALDVVAALGLITVLMSATMGLVETDIKRVIAYSTLNSLGLMFVALGSGSVTAAMLYLFVHGFFKALLFLASGSVIHATEKQDIRELGGLAAKMPVTAAVFGIGTLAMIGVIPLSGFWAKDEVLHAVDQHRSVVLYMLALISVFVTALYMTRLFVRTFLFEARDRVAWGHSHDAEPLMTLPLVLLAVLTAVGGFVVFGFVGEALGFPGGFGKFVFFEDPEPFDFAWDVAIFSTALAVGGIVTGWYFWSEKAEPARRAGEALQPAYETLRNRYYIDDAYQWVIDRVVLTLGTIVAWFDRNIVNDTAVDGSAGLGLFAGFELKFLETGKLPNYALAIVAGVIGLAVLLLVLRL